MYKASKTYEAATTGETLPSVSSINKLHLEDKRDAAKNGRVIFCDFQKVLCFEPLWYDVQGNVHDPEHELIDAVLAEGNRMGFQDWMRSRNFDTDDVIEAGIKRHLRESWNLRMPEEETALVLRQKLEDGMAKVPLNTEMIVWLTRKRFDEDYYTVLATDNMSVAIDGIRRNPHIIQAFDDVISSSDANVRCLKRDDPVTFFGVWLASRGLDFDVAVLIDDNLDNIEEFEAVGGTGLFWTEDSTSVDAQAFMNDVFGMPAVDKVEDVDADADTAADATESTNDNTNVEIVTQQETPVIDSFGNMSESQVPLSAEPLGQASEWSMPKDDGTLLGKIKSFFGF